jgi:hypothetical protein
MMWLHSLIGYKLMVAAIAFWVGLFPPPVKAQTLAQSNAQVKLLTTRISEIVVAQNALKQALADQQTAFLTMRDALALRSDQALDRERQTRLFIVDLVCKHNRVVDILTNRLTMQGVLAGTQQITQIQGKDCATTGPSPELPNTIQP